ncbi:collagen binding domain-containing protein, partial [candidate division KSB1 bacterium]
ISRIRDSGIIDRLYVVGFVESIIENILIQEMTEAGNGSYYPFRNSSLLIRDLEEINLLSQKIVSSTGMIGYRCFVTQQNGFPAYGSTVDLLDESGKIVQSKSFWRGIFENLHPGNYTLTASNGNSKDSKKVTVIENELVPKDFVFNVRIGSFEFQHFIQGTNEGKAFGAITKVLHETGETVYTGTTWTDMVSNLPEGVYTVEGYIEGLQTQQKEVTIRSEELPQMQFWYNVGKGRITYNCYLDSTENLVANGTQIQIFRMPYNELALELSQWRGTTPFLPYGTYEIEGNYKGIIRREEIFIKPDSTLELDFVFNIRQVRFIYRCFEDDILRSPATGSNVLIINEQGRTIEEGNRWSEVFLLPEGKYTLQAIYDGKTIKRTLNINASSSVVEEEIFFNRIQ